MTDDDDDNNNDKYNENYDNLMNMIYKLFKVNVY